jgi:beta-glucosidase
MLKTLSIPSNPDHAMGLDDAADVQRSSFPSSFKWGVSTASFQIEGAAREDGRGPSVWDTFCATPGNIADGSDGSVACDHYHRYVEDLDLLTQLGVTSYRFSMAWSRVQPSGEGDWSEPGFAFYDRLLTGLAERGIDAHLTLNHWDLPQALQDKGGWQNPDIIQRFCDYACEVGRRFGHRLASLATHNEPWVVAMLGHDSGIFAPGLKDRGVAMQVAHHLLLSHGVAVQALRAQGLQTPLGIVLNLSPFHAATESLHDQQKAQLEDGMLVRWYLDALLRGKYPEDVWEHLGTHVPRVNPGDLAAIQQPLDFLGVNYYTRSVVSAGTPWSAKDLGLPVTDMEWEIYPQGLTELLVRLDRDYDMPPIFITENGAAFKDTVEDGQVNDLERVAYLQSHIKAVAAARQAGVNVQAYFVWSLLDNFEWASGYAKRFGIVHIDYPTQKRTPKQSAIWYSQFLRGR